MSEREQITFYLGDFEHWRYMDTQLMHRKVNYWIKMSRSSPSIGDQTVEKLRKVRDQLKYCIKIGVNGYEVKSYQKAK